MRALIVSIVLAVAVAICMTLVVLFADLNSSSAMLASLGLSIFMVAALFAAIAALGPRFPLLTPAIAGTAAAALTTVAIIASSAHFGQAHRAEMPAGSPARGATPSVEKQSADSEPAPVQSPGVTTVPTAQKPLATPTFPNEVLPVVAAEAPMPEAGAQPQPTMPDADFAKTMVEKTLDGSNTGFTPNRAAAPEDGSSQSNWPTDTTIPIPPIVPPPSPQLILSEGVFDKSGPLRQARDGSTTTSDPPLPRFRPCGTDGPPCP